MDSHFSNCLTIVMTGLHQHLFFAGHLIGNFRSESGMLSCAGNDLRYV